MKLGSQCLTLFLLPYYLSCLAGKKNSDEQFRARIRGRLAVMLCLQYGLEENFLKPPQPHSGPLYNVNDVPCRVIQWHLCAGGSTECQKFSSKLKKPCDEKAMNGEYGEYYGGDIVNPPNRDLERGGLKDEKVRWKNRTRIGSDIKVEFPIIAYELANNIVAEKKQIIRKAIDHIQFCTCIRFEIRQANAPVHKDWLYIKTDGVGCYSTHLGRAGGKQVVNLDNRCDFGSTVHEFLHVIGFDHEHSRPDRDAYVNILRENIKPDKLFNFDKMNEAQWDSFKEMYDYHSIMHYGRQAFSKDGDAITIETTKEPYVDIGQRTGLSMSDAFQVNRMYKCSDKQYTKCKYYSPE